MSEPLWRVPLAGYCDVCGHEALALVVYPTHRVVVHVPGRASVHGRKPRIVGVPRGPLPARAATSKEGSVTIYQIEPLGPWTRPVTKHRAPSRRFSASWQDTLDLLAREIGRLGCRTAVAIRIDVQGGDIRRDGMLGAHARTDFPGVAVSFESRFGPLSYATDAYDSWQANVRAIALSLEALRAVDRYGVSKSGEQYAGWRAIESGQPKVFDSRDEAIRWLREVTGISAPDVSPGPLLRRASVALHPDHNDGERSQWNRLDAARQMIEAAG